jgi:hypothetical protein
LKPDIYFIHIQHYIHEIIWRLKKISEQGKKDHPEFWLSSPTATCAYVCFLSRFWHRHRHRYNTYTVLIIKDIFMLLFFIKHLILPHNHHLDDGTSDWQTISPQPNLAYCPLCK